MRVCGELVCYGVTRYEYVNVTEIEFLETLEGYRRKGYAKELVQFMELHLLSEWQDDFAELVGDGLEPKRWIEIDVRSLHSSKSFWEAIGYIFIKEFHSVNRHVKVCCIDKVGEDQYFEFLKNNHDDEKKYDEIDTATKNIQECINELSRDRTTFITQNRIEDLYDACEDLYEYLSKIN